MANSAIFDLGFCGGLFWRLHRFQRAGDVHAGHKHLIDHATLISQGGVRCEIEGHETKEYWAPSIIEIDKDLRHQFTALADDTIYFCIFATNHVDATKTATSLSQAQKDSMLAGLAALHCGSCSGCAK